MADDVGPITGERELEEHVNSLLVGAIDMHCHSGPSVMHRCLDHIEAAQEASSAGMRALLFKDHFYSVTPVVELLRDRYAHLGVEMVSGVPLNDTCGGLNPYAVDHGLKLGARMIWMPTFSAANHIRHNYRGHRLVTAQPMLPAKMLTVLDEDGKLKDEVKFILDQIAEAHGKMVMGGPGRSVEDLLMLNLANAARPRLAHMLAQDVFHPAELYLELAGLAGSMATYGSSARRLGELPAYDHMAPGPAYSALADALRSLILSLRYIEPKSRALPVMRHSTNVWKIRIDNPKLLVASRIVIRVGSELSEDALRKIFVNQATVGSADQFEGLWKSRLPGIPLKPLHSQPREIPYDGDRLCLELDQKSEHWASLLDAPGFVIGVSGVLPSEPQVDCYSVNR